MDAFPNFVSLGLRNHFLSHLSAEPPGNPVRIKAAISSQLPAFRLISLQPPPSSQHERAES
jgi:hypothetical protein